MGDLVISSAIKSLCGYLASEGTPAFLHSNAQETKLRSFWGSQVPPSCLFPSQFFSAPTQRFLSAP